MAQDQIPKNQIKSRNTIEQREHEDNAAARRVTPVDKDGEFFDENNRFPVDAIVNISDIDTPTIANIPVPLANTEHSYTFPDGTSKISIKVRGGHAIIKYAWEEDESDTNFITVGYGNEEIIDGVSLNNKTLYFQVSKDNQIIEIQSWS